MVATKKSNGGSRAPHGARGLKPRVEKLKRYYAGGRAPHGARGLKLFERGLTDQAAESRPARGAWIETLPALLRALPCAVAPRTGRVD